MKIPVFVVHGFLEGGKTRFALETLADEYFSDGERNLVLACEEGIEEYEEEILKQANATLVMLEDKTEFNETFLAECQKKYKPTQIVLEYNCMWGMDFLRDMYMPKGWFVAQVITVVDASTFDVYLKNMKSIFMEMAKDSDLIIFNRSSDETPAAVYKRNMRAVNPKAQVVFEREDGTMLKFEEELPFDLDAEVIEIADTDYGIWYIDAMDHPERYDGKTLRFKGMAYTGKHLPEGYFVPGRMAMTCCADDTAFIGFLCRSSYVDRLKQRQWLTVTAKAHMEKRPEYNGEEGIVLHSTNIKKAEKPEEELVYF
ncbi:MAG: GTPase [Lachnospiraceae bacterium]|jgi:Predicted membrane protein|nr:GTPase [Lachnospiraceae bacterium]MCI9657015.1 GTPase [Lachnospiraceae bacterium]